MFAYQIKQYGKQETLVLNEIPKPIVTEQSVLVKVQAASVNPVDYKIRNGDAKFFLRYSMPLTLGHDFSGVVAAVGSDVTQFKVGDQVYGRTPRTGSFQEYVAVGENDIALAPKNLSLVEAAAVPLAGLTAYQGLFDWIQLKKGQSILVLGGAGGVGHIAVQLACLAGAKVYTTVSEEGKEFLETFGEMTFIDYHKEQFYDVNVMPQVDAVFDMRGGNDLREAFNCVKPGGAIASITSIPTPDYAKAAGMNRFFQAVLALATRKIRRLAKEKEIKFDAFLTQSNQKELGEITKLIEAGKLTAAIQQVYPASEINEAMAAITSGHVKGKLVVDFTK